MAAAQVDEMAGRLQYPWAAPGTLCGVFGIALLAWFAAPAIAEPSAITEFRVPSPKHVGTITRGPGGNLWFTEASGLVDGTIRNDGKIGRITPAGVITEFALPPSTLPAGITAGPDGNLWFTMTVNDTGLPGKIGRITSAGMITEFALPLFPNAFGLQVTGTPGAITTGPDGNLWFTLTEGSFGGPGKVGRITPSGVVTEFPLSLNAPQGITAGPDGSLWVTEINCGGHHCTSVSIARISTAGVVTEFAVPDPDPVVLDRSVGGITAGPDGNLWFAEGFRQGANISRITPSGVITQFPLSSVIGAIDITAGPDGNLWFTAVDTSGVLLIGLITVDGTVTAFPVSSSTPAFAAGGITAGPDANIWFTETVAFDSSSMSTVSKVVRLALPAVSAISVYRASSGEWFRTFATGAPRTVTWGCPACGDVPVAADYDGDGKADVAVYRRTTGDWFILNSATSTLRQQPWGAPGDVPVPADYDGDGKADLAVYRPSTGEWFILRSSDGTLQRLAWGAPDDLPVPNDYDGDGKADVAVYRPSTGEWFIVNSSTAMGRHVQWGAAGDVPVAADYDGDNKADIAVFRATTGEWFIFRSGDATAFVLAGGILGGVPVAADYDGDGKADLALYLPQTGEWFIRYSVAGMTDVTWGCATCGDIPVPAKY